MKIYFAGNFPLETFACWVELGKLKTIKHVEFASNRHKDDINFKSLLPLIYQSVNIITSNLRDNKTCSHWYPQIQRNFSNKSNWTCNFYRIYGICFKFCFIISVPRKWKLSSLGNRWFRSSKNQNDDHKWNIYWPQ